MKDLSYEQVYHLRVDLSSEQLVESCTKLELDQSCSVVFKGLGCVAL